MNNVAGLAWEMKERAGLNSKNRADAGMMEWDGQDRDGVA